MNEPNKPNKPAVNYPPEVIEDEFEDFFASDLPYGDKLDYLERALDAFGPNVVLSKKSRNGTSYSYPIFFMFIEGLLEHLYSSKRVRYPMIEAVKAFLERPEFELKLLNFSSKSSEPPIHALINSSIELFIYRDKKNIPDDILGLIDLMLKKGADPFQKYKGESAALMVEGILNVQGVTELPNAHRVPTESLERLKRAFQKFYDKEYGTPGALNKGHQKQKRFTLRKNRPSDPTNMYNRNRTLTENLRGNYNRSRNSALNRNLAD